ncbi:hypothetical protein BDK51DRAFT_40887, partial [Blyttiomyces helicus]
MARSASDVLTPLPFFQERKADRFERMHVVARCWDNWRSRRLSAVEDALSSQLYNRRITGLALRAWIGKTVRKAGEIAPGRVLDPWAGTQRAPGFRAPVAAAFLARLDESSTLTISTIAQIPENVEFFANTSPIARILLTTTVSIPNGLRPPLRPGRPPEPRPLTPHPVPSPPRPKRVASPSLSPNRLIPSTRILLSRCLRHWRARTQERERLSRLAASIGDRAASRDAMKAWIEAMRRARCKAIVARHSHQLISRSLSRRKIIATAVRCWRSRAFAVQLDAARALRVANTRRMRDSMRSWHAAAEARVQDRLAVAFDADRTARRALAALSSAVRARRIAVEAATEAFTVSSQRRWMAAWMRAARLERIHRRQRDIAKDVWEFGVQRRAVETWRGRVERRVKQRVAEARFARVVARSWFRAWAEKVERRR